MEILLFQWNKLRKGIYDAFPEKEYFLISWVLIHNCSKIDANNMFFLWKPDMVSLLDPSWLKQASWVQGWAIAVKTLHTSTYMSHARQKLEKIKNKSYKSYIIKQRKKKPFDFRFFFFLLTQNSAISLWWCLVYTRPGNLMVYIKRKSMYAVMCKWKYLHIHAYS